LTGSLAKIKIHAASQGLLSWKGTR